MTQRRRDDIDARRCLSLYRLAAVAVALLVVTVLPGALMSFYRMMFPGVAGDLAVATLAIVWVVWLGRLLVTLNVRFTSTEPAASFVKRAEADDPARVGPSPELVELARYGGGGPGGGRLFEAVERFVGGENSPQLESSRTEVLRPLTMWEYELPPRSDCVNAGALAARGAVRASMSDNPSAGESEAPSRAHEGAWSVAIPWSDPIAQSLCEIFSPEKGHLVSRLAKVAYVDARAGLIDQDEVRAFWAPPDSRQKPTLASHALARLAADAKILLVETTDGLSVSAVPMWDPKRPTRLTSAAAEYLAAARHSVSPRATWDQLLTVIELCAIASLMGVPAPLQDKNRGGSFAWAIDPSKVRLIVRGGRLARLGEFLPWREDPDSLISWLGMSLAQLQFVVASADPRVPRNP
jgi:hypothetical protein